MKVGKSKPQESGFVFSSLEILPLTPIIEIKAEIVCHECSVKVSEWPPSLKE